jgi:preprotein translocase subunit SecG
MILNKKKRDFLKKIVFFIPIIFINNSLFLTLKKNFKKKENKLIWYLNKND